MGIGGSYPSYCIIHWSLFIAVENKLSAFDSILSYWRILFSVMHVVNAFKIRWTQHTRNLPFIAQDIRFLHPLPCLCTVSILSGVCPAIHSAKIHFRAQASVIWALSHGAKTGEEMLLHCVWAANLNCFLLWMFGEQVTVNGKHNQRPLQSIRMEWNSYTYCICQCTLWIWVTEYDLRAW